MEPSDTPQALRVLILVVVDCRVRHSLDNQSSAGQYT